MVPRTLAVAVVWAALSVLAGCSPPRFGACAVQCDPSGGCPVGLTCNSADGYCHDSTGELSCIAGGDGGPGSDAERDRDDGDPGGDGGMQVTCSMIDLLFIVDDSGTMDDEQEALATAIPAFVTALDAHRTEAGDPLDYRIGVTTTGRDVTYVTSGFPVPTTELGPDGELLTLCDPARWFERGHPNLGAELACRVAVGTDGPSIEMPGYALELAFTARVDDGLNAGFRRPAALFAVIVVTDENDCSRRDDNFALDINGNCPATAPLLTTAEQIAFLDQLTGDRSRWSLAISAGPSTTSCTSTFGDATAAPRLGDLVTAAGASARLYSVCDNPATTLASALAQFAAACE